MAKLPQGMPPRKKVAPLDPDVLAKLQEDAINSTTIDYATKDESDLKTSVPVPQKNVDVAQVEAEESVKEEIASEVYSDNSDSTELGIETELGSGTRVVKPSNRKVTYKQVSVDPKLVKVWSGNPRPHDEVSVDKLVPDIIATNGNIMPVLMRPNRTGGSEKYELIYGSQRYYASIEAGTNLFGDVQDLNDEEARYNAEVENQARTELSEIALCRQARDNFEFYKRSHPNTSLRAYAQIKGLSKSTLSQTFKIADIDDRVYKKGNHEEWSKKSGEKVVDLVNALGEERFIEWLKKYPEKMTVSEIKKTLEHFLTGDKPIDVKPKVYNFGRGCVTIKTNKTGSKTISISKEVPAELQDKISRYIASLAK